MCFEKTESRQGRNYGDNLGSNAVIIVRWDNGCLEEMSSGHI